MDECRVILQENPLLHPYEIGSNRIGSVGLGTSGLGSGVHRGHALRTDVGLTGQEVDPLEDPDPYNNDAECDGALNLGCGQQRCNL